MADGARDLQLALERLHEESFGWALACCGRRPAEAREALQAAYLKVLDGRAAFDGRSSFRTFLFGVIRRTAAEERRREALRRLRLVSIAATQEPLDPAPGAADGMVRSEEARRLVAALARLPRRQREVLDLVFYHDLTIAEAATVMGVGVGTARVHYERGKARLRALLGSSA